MSLFAELGLLDRPFIPFVVTIRGQAIKFQARALSGREMDECEALQMDAYGKALMELSEGTDEKVSELERIRRYMATLPVEELAKQLLMTRDADVTARAMQITDIDFKRELEYVKTLTPEEADEYSKAQNLKWEDGLGKAREEILAEYREKPVDELARTLAQVTINVRAIKLSRDQYAQAFLYCSLYDMDGKRVYANREEVLSELKPETIKAIVDGVHEALKTDIPFGSSVEEEPDKQPSSPSTSEEVIEDGGTPTTTTPDA